MGVSIAGGNFMRSLLVKSGIIVFIVLAVGSGLTLAAASSEPGMFLYPIKQTTQKFTGANGDTALSQPTMIDVLQDGPSQQPSAAGGSTSPQDIQEDVAQEPEITETPEPDQAASTPVPTPIRVTDEITVTAGPGKVPTADIAITGGVDNAPAINELSSGYDGHSRDDDASDNSRSDEGTNDGQSNENDNEHSESSDDDDSDDNSEGDH